MVRNFQAIWAVEHSDLRGVVFLAKTEVVFTLNFLPQGQTMNAWHYISILDLRWSSTEFHKHSRMCNISTRLCAMSYSQITHELVTSQRVESAQWPGNSPDLNPIEKLWMLIKKKVSASNPTTLDELKQTIKEIWRKDIGQNVCKNLAESRLSCFQKVIKNKGYQPHQYQNTSATSTNVIWTMFAMPGFAGVFLVKSSISPYFLNRKFNGN